MAWFIVNAKRFHDSGAASLSPAFDFGASRRNLMTTLVPGRQTAVNIQEVGTVQVGWLPCQGFL